MKRPYRTLRPASRSPVLLTCEHATRRLPDGIRPTRDVRAVLATHWGFDIGAWHVTRGVARRTGFGAIGGAASRLWIDLNRRVDDPTLIRDEAEGVALAFNRGLSPAERERRVLEWHAPYHEAIDRLLLRRLVRGVRPVLLAMHSFTPVLHHRERRFDVGVLYDTHVALARRLARGVRAAGLTVRYNEPYSGMAGMMYAADRHGSHYELPCLELEIKQSLIDTVRKADAMAERLAPAIAALVGSTAGAR